MINKWNEQRFLNRLMEMIRIDSPSGEERRMTEYLEGYFRKKGYKVLTDDSGKLWGSNGGNVLVHIPGTLDLEPICFNAHMDTVMPGKGIEPVFENGILRSRGDTILGGDDKIGIAMLIEAAETLEEQRMEHREMYFLFTIGEEVMKGAAYYDSSFVKAKHMLILDGAGSPEYLLKASKGKTFVSYRFYGKKAHAGVDIESGVNAVCMAAEAVAQMSFPEKDEVWDTTVNITSIHGGTNGPTVPDYAEVTAEIRSFSQEAGEKRIRKMNQIAKQAAKNAGGRAEIEETPVCRPYKGEPTGYLYRRLERAMLEEGIRPVEVTTGGSSDGNIFGERGFSCCGLAVGMHQVHTTEEYVDLKEAALAYRILLNIMTG